jgi:DNA-directed RNA polymerase specialized sigma24 family protein
VRELDDEEPAVDPDRFITAGAARRPGGWAYPPQLWNPREARMLSAETRGVIDEAIAELPPVQREVITLRDLLGMEADEACRVIGLTAGNQRVLLHVPAAACAVRWTPISHRSRCNVEPRGETATGRCTTTLPATPGDFHGARVSLPHLQRDLP